MDAKQILELIAGRHSKDVFVSECKNGPTHSPGVGGMIRLDAWAMCRSWMKPNVHGYEIKVSRRDFLADNKWHHYLPYCTHFWFAVAPGVCDPSEVPEQVGLCVASTNGTRLYTKRKAAYRDVQIPEDIFRYVLMCRSRITAERFDSESNLDYWRGWLAEKQESREIGRRCSTALRESFNRDVETVRRENHRLERAMEGYDKIAALCEEIGISPHSYVSVEKIREQLGGTSVPRNLRRAIDSVIKSAGVLDKCIAAEATA